MVLLVIALFGGSIAFLLWPSWPSAAVPPDAPAIPITVGGVGFNVPPAAIRMPVQRRAGAHERVDLAYLWPSLEPPDATAKPAAPSPAPQIEGVPLSTHPQERIFITIAGAGDTLPPVERVRTIYPRYLEKEAAAGPDGLAVLPFREGSPYQGEDLIYDPGQPENFLVRCTRNGLGPDAGHVPPRAPHRRRRPDRAISARLARRLARGGGGHRAADCESWQTRVIKRKASVPRSSPRRRGPIRRLASVGNAHVKTATTRRIGSPPSRGLLRPQPLDQFSFRSSRSSARMAISK